MNCPGGRLDRLNLIQLKRSGAASIPGGHANPAVPTGEKNAGAAQLIQNAWGFTLKSLSGNFTAERAETAEILTTNRRGAENAAGGRVILWLAQEIPPNPPLQRGDGGISSASSAPALIRLRRTKG